MAIQNHKFALTQQCSACLFTIVTEKACEQESANVRAETWRLTEHLYSGDGVVGDIQSVQFLEVADVFNPADQVLVEKPVRGGGWEEVEERETGVEIGGLALAHGTTMQSHELCSWYVCLTGILAPAGVQGPQSSSVHCTLARYILTLYTPLVPQCGDTLHKMHKASYDTQSIATGNGLIIGHTFVV